MFAGRRPVSTTHNAATETGTTARSIPELTRWP
ncbi:hypothetical protein GGI64_001391 [Rhizobium leguminosarum]|uniref:Uncharacterized protein n=2 Tax=Rhizobium leguminosarum TaxID=384 RepID=I9NF52_RHILT|nr:hypothetical protein Rleg9DRAFT_5505 [Rhizobium leguminosarum bv. trifolii WSM597]MBB3646560.1 hypothetical protein [Rhizobium sp. BK619]MBB5662073.1 hypothetical protein [Rhizobium leguminosarum]NYJ10344.1 hypothetical protein [Rhizobium leguminosarum]